MTTTFFPATFRAHPTLLAALTLVAVVLGHTLAAKTQNWSFGLIPMTLQTASVLCAALLLPRTLSLGAIVAYLALGAAGLPVFAGGGGWVYFFGASFGFLMGYALATIIISTLRDFFAPSLARDATLLLLGMAAIYATGLGWGMALNPALGEDWQALLAWGFYPFWVKDALTATALACLAVGIRQARGRKQA